VTKKQRTIWDDLVELGREVLERIDEAFNPDKKRKPARVPVPVPIHNPQPQNDDHRY
jgi:hypothetical protein